MASQRALEAILRFMLDRQSVQDVKRGSKTIEDSLQEVRDKAEQVEKQMDEVRNWSGYFGDLATSALFFGAALSGPLLLATNQYVSATGKAEATSRQWMGATEDLQRSYQRIGRVSARAILPVLETAADIAEKVADYAEQHPGAIQAMLFGGGALVGLAAVGEAVERGIRLYTDAKSLYYASQQVLAGKLMEKAANKQLAAAGQMGKPGLGGLGGIGGKGALALAGSIAGGTVIGGVAANQITGDEDYSGRFLRQTVALPSAFATKGILNLGEAIGAIDGEKANQLGNDLGKIFDAWGNEGAMEGLKEAGRFWGIISDGSDDVKEAADAADEFLNKGQALESFIAFQQASAEAEKQFADQRRSIIEQAGEERAAAEARSEERRNKIIEEYNQRRAEELTDFEREWARNIRDFNKNEIDEQEEFEKDRMAVLESARKRDRKIEADYYEQRTELLADSNDEIQRMEADHQKNMRRMREDHDLRMIDAIREQDATAFLKEQQSYDRQRRRAEEDHQDEMSRRDEEASARLAEMEADFEKEKELRRQSLDEQLAEMQTAYEEEKQDRMEAFEQRRADAEADFEYQRQREAQHHEQMLQEFDDQAEKELQAIEAKKTEQLDQLRSQHAEEKEIREQAFADQLRDLDAHYLGEREVSQEYYAQMEEDFEKWLGNMAGKVGSNRPDYPSKQIGGYVGSGLYNLHEGEFVLNPHATRTAENMIGGPLNQSNLLAALAGRGGMGGRNMTYSPNYQFNERDDGRLIMAQVESMFDRKMLELERGY